MQNHPDSRIQKKSLSLTIFPSEHTYKQEVIFRNPNMAVFLKEIPINALKSSEILENSLQFLQIQFWHLKFHVSQ